MSRFFEITVYKKGNFSFHFFFLFLYWKCIIRSKHEFDKKKKKICKCLKKFELGQKKKKKLG